MHTGITTDVNTVTCTVCSLFWKMSLAVILSPAYDTGEACKSVCYYCEKG